MNFYSLIGNIVLVIYRNLVKALWCIAQALGTLLNAAIALIAMKLLYEFLLYAALMSVVVCAFVAINWNFKYR